jgi:meckelin
VDTESNYIDVPVKIKNYVDSSGDNPNESSDIGDWKLTRRFFIFDTKSGIEGSGAYSAGETYSSYIRWLHKVSIEIELDPEGTDEMYIPYVELEYRSKSLSFIEDSSTDSISFMTSYKFNSSDYWLAALIIFGIVNGVVFIITAFKVYCWTRRHPSQLMGSVYGFKLVYKIIFYFCDTWSTLMFWYLFSVSASVYAFFKLGTSPLLMMFQDENNNLTPFAVIFAFIFVFKVFAVFSKVLSQTFASFYVLDREKNMSNLYSTLSNALQQAEDGNRDFYDREVKEEEEPKAWRPIFVMNELNELLTSKVVHVEVVLIWTLFLLQGQGWEFASEYDPEINFSNSRSPESYVISFFTYSLTILLTGFLIYIVRYAISFVFPPDYMEFEDLCTVANISLFIFDEKFHGYYIHGESPGNSADVTLDTLKRELDREGDGTATFRGLVPSNPKLQTYEFYIPYSLRKIFDQVFEENKENQKKKKGDEEVYKKKKKKEDFIYKSGNMGAFEDDFRKVTQFHFYSFNINIYRSLPRRMRWTTF